MDCLPESQSNQMMADSPGMAASTTTDDIVMTPAHNDDAEDVSAKNVEEAEGSHDGEEVTYPFFDPLSTLPILASANPDQVCQPDLTSAGGENSQIHIPGSSWPFDCELEMLQKEEENLSKTFDTKRSKLNAELERKIAELCSEYDAKVKEVDAEYDAYEKESNAQMNALKLNSLLANAFVSKCTDPRAATRLRAVRARSSQRLIQQWQGNRNMNPTASPAFPNPSGPLLTVHAEVQSNDQSSTALSLPSVAAEALSPLSNTTQPRPPPLISNHQTPSASRIVRTPAPHLQGYRGSRFPNASVTYRRRLAQEQRQQQGNSNGGELVCLSDDEE